MALPKEIVDLLERLGSDMASFRSNPCFLRLMELNSRLEGLSESTYAWILLYICLSLVLFLRRPDSLTNPIPHNEDGTVFLRQALLHSYSSLFMTYQGYLHTIPRLVTLLAIQFGLKNAPFIMNLFALLITVASISYLFSKDFRFLIRNDFLRFITAILIVCMPIPEIINALFNIQWILSIYLILWTTNLIFGSGSTNLAKTIFAVLGFLTCAMGVILLPALAWFIYKSRSISVSVVFFISALTNLFYFSIRSAMDHIYINPVGIIIFISTQIFTSFYYIHVSSFVEQYGYISTYMISIATIVIIIYYSKDDRTVVGWIAYLIIAYVFLIAFTRPNYMNFMDGYYIYEGLRYSFIPLCLILILCIMNLKNRNYLMYIILFIFLINIATNYSIPIMGISIIKQTLKNTTGRENATALFLYIRLDGPSRCHAIAAFQRLSAGKIMPLHSPGRASTMKH